jgi:hypothetical protein
VWAFVLCYSYGFTLICSDHKIPMYGWWVPDIAISVELSALIIPCHCMGSCLLVIAICVALSALIISCHCVDS